VLDEVHQEVTQEVNKLNSVIGSQEEKLENIQQHVGVLITQLQQSNLEHQNDRQHEQRAFQEMLSMQEKAYQARLQETINNARAEAEENLRQERHKIEAHFAEVAKQEVERNRESIIEEYTQLIQKAQQKMVEIANDTISNEILLFEKKTYESLQEAEARHVRAAQERLDKLQKYQEEINKVNRALEDNKKRIEQNGKVHGISIALFGLGTALSSPLRKPFVQELSKLKQAAGNDTTVETIAKPLEVLSYEGVSSYAQLLDRFKSVAQSGRQAALVPEEGGFVGNIVAAVASRFIIPEKGLVEGNDPEALLAQTEYYLEQGDLVTAVAHAEKLKGMPATVVRDWIVAAKDRIVADQSLSALQAHAAALSVVDNIGGIIKV